MFSIIDHHHHPGPDENVNFKVVYDADLIVNLEERQKETPLEREDLITVIDKDFLTEGGRALAKSVLLKERQ